MPATNTATIHPVICTTNIHLGMDKRVRLTAKNYALHWIEVIQTVNGCDTLVACGSDPAFAPPAAQGQIQQRVDMCFEGSMYWHNDRKPEVVNRIS